MPNSNKVHFDEHGLYLEHRAGGTVRPVWVKPPEDLEKWRKLIKLILRRRGAVVIWNSQTAFHIGDRVYKRWLNGYEKEGWVSVSTLDRSYKEVWFWHPPQKEGGDV